jgi:ubiquinol-cytochrome c reductase iron-sulfur subunit
MSTQTEHEADFDVDDPRLSRFELVREGARRDGVEIVHYAQRFPVPGTRAERRIERTIGLCFMLCALGAIAFVVAFIWWPWEYKSGSNLNKLYTPVLGLTLTIALGGLAMGIIIWGKKLLPEEVAVQDRHDGASPHDERKLTAATIVNMGDELGVQRRPLLIKGSLGLAGLGLGAATVAPLVGGLIVSPHTHPNDVLFHTGWDPQANGGKPVQMVHDDMTPVRPEDVSIGGQITVFPGIPGGNTNEHADSPVLLIHLREDDAKKLRENLVHVPINNPDHTEDGDMWNNFVAYSKICTHAGCPASLYEQQTNRLLCPCHQSQFDITDNARPIFGPATRRLPMLPLDVENGVFVAKSDFRVPIGPAFWERP